MRGKIGCVHKGWRFDGVFGYFAPMGNMTIAVQNSLLTPGLLWFPLTHFFLPLSPNYLSFSLEMAVGIQCLGCHGWG